MHGGPRGLPRRGHRQRRRGVSAPQSSAPQPRLFRPGFLFVRIARSGCRGRGIGRQECAPLEFGQFPNWWFGAPKGRDWIAQGDNPGLSTKTDESPEGAKGIAPFQGFSLSYQLNPRRCLGLSTCAPSGRRISQTQGRQECLPHSIHPCKLVKGPTVDLRT